MVTEFDTNNNERKHINKKKNTKRPKNDKKSKSQQPLPKKGKKKWSQK